MRSFASGMIAMAVATKRPQHEGCSEHTELATEQYVCEASQIYDSKSKKSMFF